MRTDTAVLAHQKVLEGNSDKLGEETGSILESTSHTQARVKRELGTVESAGTLEQKGFSCH